MGLEVAIPVVALAIGAYLLRSRRLRASESWRATLTPLASIMGSGFLISAPLLAGIVGVWALPCMAALLAVAYGLGEVLRFNIRHFEPIEHGPACPPQSVALLSRLVLAAAYFVSVSYYLQLLATFALDAFGLADPVLANVVTTALLVVIAGIGMWRGLEELESVETYAVSLNLGMIGALLLTLLFHNGALLLDGSWKLPAVESSIDLGDLRVLLGLLIVVQGFETSRYLGGEHSAEVRIRTMRSAQLIAAAVYLVFVGGTTVLFHDGLGADVTAILELTAPIAAILPVLLSLAAIGSQFSAAVADTSGAAGLLEELAPKRLRARHAYVLLLAVTIAITWGTDVNGVIAYASRGFALYYALQGLVALLVLREDGALTSRGPRYALYGSMTAVGFAVFLFGLPTG